MPVAWHASLPTVLRGQRDGAVRLGTSMVQLSSVLLLIGTLALPACSAEGGPATQPTPLASPGGSSTSPDAYLDSVLAIMQTASINSAEIDWAAFRTTVAERAAGARTIGDVFPAISVALQLLDDHESYVMTREGGADRPSAGGRMWRRGTRPGGSAGHGGVCEGRLVRLRRERLDTVRGVNPTGHRERRSSWTEWMRSSTCEGTSAETCGR